MIGGPIGAAILAKGIVVNQMGQGKIDKSPSDDGVKLQDLVNGDDGQTDLGDLQYVLFNTVALVFFYGEFLIAPQAGALAAPNAVPGNRNAVVSFVPGATGGSPIAKFTATSQPDAHTGESENSPINVYGLTNGTPYTFTVRAENILGAGTDSPPSSPSLQRPRPPSLRPSTPRAVTAASRSPCRLHARR